MAGGRRSANAMVASEDVAALWRIGSESLEMSVVVRSRQSWGLGKVAHMVSILDDR